jgi:RimJ/RimL family protein N-acetyltransferase
MDAATDPVLTPRLVLTPVGPGDVDDLDLLYRDPLVAYWTGPWTRPAVEAWAAHMAARWAEELAWAAEHHPALPVVAFTEVHNHASRAVMERLGMRQVGSLRRDGLVEGRTGVHPDAPFALYRF